MVLLYTYVVAVASLDRAPGKNRVKISPGDGVKTPHAKSIRIYIEGIRGLSHPPFLKSGQPGPWLARAGVQELPHRGTQVRRPPPRREKQTQSQASHAIYRADISRVRQNICRL